MGGWRRLVLLAATLVLVVGLAVDATRPPAEQLSARALLWSIDRYQALGSLALARAGVRCRFLPSCSRYAEVSIRRRGALRGGFEALARIARCGPWTAAGSVDPPT